MSSRIGDKEKIRIIHLLISLGISHYFDKEIEEILDQAFGKLNDIIAKEDDLETISLMFEVFRLYGHKMSCDAFERFKGEDGRFKENLAGDVRGMLQLYHAAQFGTPSEDIIEEALSFTRNQLECFALQETSTLPPHLITHIRNALYRSRCHNMEILAAREYVSFYDHEEGHDELLLRFAKLSLNYCRLLYIQEIKTLTKWWKNTDVPSKLPYVRDRILETYFPAIGVYFEPRNMHGKMGRWDLGAIEELPGYLRIVARTLLETMGEIEREMKPRGRTASVQHTIDEVTHIKRRVILCLGRAYLAISNWARAGHVPTFEEYMEVGMVTAGMDDFASYSFIAMEDCDEKPFFEWLNSKPRIFQALCAMYRVTNDIATYELEMKRGEVANGVNCYMKQHGVTKEETVEEFNKLYRESHKIMMEEFLTTVCVPRQVLMRCLNISRTFDVMYKEGDGYTEPLWKSQRHHYLFFKVIAALVPGPWVMGISAGWFRAREIRRLAIGNQVRITGLRAIGNHLRITVSNEKLCHGTNVCMHDTKALEMMDINGCGKLLDQDLTPSLSFLRVNSCPLLTEKFAEAEQESSPEQIQQKLCELNAVDHQEASGELPAYIREQLKRHNP
ncbi:hypothetical protein Bca4012_004181 [Brassica carinata]